MQLVFTALAFQPLRDFVLVALASAAPLAPPPAAAVVGLWGQAHLKLVGKGWDHSQVQQHSIRLCSEEADFWPLLVEEVMALPPAPAFRVKRVVEGVGVTVAVQAAQAVCLLVAAPATPLITAAPGGLLVAVAAQEPLLGALAA